MKKVTKINPIATETFDKPKLRVAAYCRVSTDSDDQLQSLDAQIKYYESYIKANPAWEYAGLYYDEGVTGTKKDKRLEFLRMIADCEKQKIDLIVTKSISRFARNATDCLELVRKLKKLGIYIIFEKESINTGEMENELMLSILSGLAESESASIAENNKWGVQHRFQNGSYKITSTPYGYDSIDGKLVVNETQAKIVRFIFSEILSGNGTDKIADELNHHGVPSKKGNRWTGTTIRGMIANEKYIGDAIYQKTYTDTYFNRHSNTGEKDQFLIKNNHEAIIGHEKYEAAQAIIEQHSKEKGVEKHQVKYRNRYPFSSIILCGECGAKFKRRIHNADKHNIAWCCTNHIEDAEKCSMKFVLETDFEYAFITMMNKLIFSHQAILKPLLMNLRGINSKDSVAKLKELVKKLEENAEQRKILVSLQTRGYLEPAVYNKGNNELLQEAERIQKQKDSLSRFIYGDNKHLHEVSELLQYASKAVMLEGFDGELFTRFVERIYVYSRTEVGFELKCGITLKERLVG